MFKTGLLLAAMTALFLAIGFMLGGEAGMMVALFFALATNAATYWFSDRMVLRMYRAQPLAAADHPELTAMIEQLSHNAGIPTPKAYLIDTLQPNAFATGRSPQHASIAVTSGLLDMLEQDEVAAVIAHELGHVKNRDTLIMTITATIAGAIGMLAHFTMFFGGRREDGRSAGMVSGLMIALLAPLMAMLVQMAISRTREYSADRSGAEFSGMPLKLASALRKISAGTQRIPNHLAESHPGTAHLFIANPLGGRAMDGLFSTHPNTENRILELEKLASESVHKMPQPVARKGSFQFPRH